MIVAAAAGLKTEAADCQTRMPTAEAEVTDDSELMAKLNPQADLFRMQMLVPKTAAETGMKSQSKSHL